VENVRELCVPALIIVLCIPFFLPLPCRADPVWSDDFDDLNYDGWTATNGTFTAADGTLRPDGVSNVWRIIRPSSVAYGTWSFDALGLVNIGAPGYNTMILFVTVIPVPENAYSGLGIVLGGRIARMSLCSVLSGEVSAEELRGNRYFPEGTNRLAWQHYDITRSSDGRICVYLNGTLVIDQTYVPMATSNYFSFVTSDAGARIDNIVVSDTVDIPPPRPQSQPFYMQPWFLAITGSIAIFAVVLVFLLRRKK